jgi:4-hydroxy-2-oxoheptanedioate aldolase
VSFLRNFVKKKLRDGETAIGAWCSILNKDVARAVAGTGLDWVLFDMEHGPPSLETIDSLVNSVMGLGALPLVRVVWNDINAIKQALDTGAYGIVVPWVNSGEEAKNAVLYSQYAPEGLRGCAAGRPAAAWGISGEEYMEIANDEILVAVQIETMKALENIEDIVSVDGVDTTFIGPSDLSASYGLRGQFWHPKVVKAMETVLDACNSAGIAPGIAFGKHTEHCKELISKGFRFIAVGGDEGFLVNGAKNVASQFT